MGARAARRVSPLDWLMVAIAVGSVALLLLATFGDLPVRQQLLIFWVDVGVCVVFALDFFVRWRRAGWGLAFVLRNWYEVLGMLPISHPALHSLRWLRIVVMLARLGRAVDRTVGEQITARLVNRFTGALVDVIKQPITVAVLEEVIDVLRTGHYARNLARAVDENKQELRQLVVDKIKADPQAGRLRVLPFHDEIVGGIADTVLRVMMEMLNDPRTDEMIADALRENVDQLRTAVRTGHTTLPPGVGQPNRPSSL